jgi:hypothetical protein
MQNSRLVVFFQHFKYFTPLDVMISEKKCNIVLLLLLYVMWIFPLLTFFKIFLFFILYSLNMVSIDIDLLYLSCSMFFEISGSVVRYLPLIWKFFSYYHFTYLFFLLPLLSPVGNLITCLLYLFLDSLFCVLTFSSSQRFNLRTFFQHQWMFSHLYLVYWWTYQRHASLLLTVCSISRIFLFIISYSLQFSAYITSCILSIFFH